MSYLVSRRFDWSFFVAPGALSLLIALWWGTTSDRPQESGLGLWIAGVLLVDVAHVWASIYRTYLDPQARRLHGARLWVIPLLCFGLGFTLHLAGAALFWRVLAYVAIFHFIKQHLGFALLYARKAGENHADRQLLQLAIWTGTAVPVIWWHSHLPRNFAWFLEGDLIVGLPVGIGQFALWAALPFWLFFLARRFRPERRNPGSLLATVLCLLPALTWHCGIVWFNDDRIFTMTNVFLHGVPYLALVWQTGGADYARNRLRARSLPAAIATYYGIVVALAFAEEGLWDRLLWHDHPQLFGSSTLELSPVASSFAVAILTLPQATHYVLDRYIWRVGPDNPRLAGQLGFAAKKEPGV